LCIGWKLRALLDPAARGLELAFAEVGSDRHRLAHLFALHQTELARDVSFRAIRLGATEVRPSEWVKPCSETPRETGETGA